MCFMKFNEQKKRKGEFKTSSRIIEQDRTKVFVKSAVSNDAQAFLQRIAERDNLARDFFRGCAEVVTGIVRGGSIHYPYVPCPNIEDIVADAIKKDVADFGVNYVKDYIHFIKGLPAEDCQPIEFMKVFEIPNEQLSKPIRCFTYAPIDCLPRNILIGKQIWYVVDNEWTFGFPMPTDFLIYRGIYSLIIALQEQIQSSISIEQPAALFSGYGKKRTYIPCSWLDLLLSATSQIPLSKLYYWEWLFQSKVNVNPKLGRLRLEENPSIVTSTKPVSPWISALISMCSWLRWKSIKYSRLLRKYVLR